MYYLGVKFTFEPDFMTFQTIEEPLEQIRVYKKSGNAAPIYAYYYPAPTIKRLVISGGGAKGKDENDSKKY